MPKINFFLFLHMELYVFCPLLCSSDSIVRISGKMNKDGACQTETSLPSLA